MTKGQFKKQVGTRPFEVTFNTLAGEKRVMKATLDEEYIANHNGTPKGTGTVAEAAKQLRVFDMAKNAWRIVNLETVKDLKVLA